MGDAFLPLWLMREDQGCLGGMKRNNPGRKPGRKGGGGEREPASVESGVNGGMRRRRGGGAAPVKPAVPPHPRRRESEASSPRGPPRPAHAPALTPQRSLATLRLYLPRSPHRSLLCVVRVRAVSREPSTRPACPGAVGHFGGGEGYEDGGDAVPALETQSLPPASRLCAISELPERVPRAGARLSCGTAHKAKLCVPQAASPRDVGAGRPPPRLRLSKLTR